MIPRVAHDNIAAILLQHGGEMWFLRTNQVGGEDPTILPLAPTQLFGDYVVIPVAFSRLIESLKFPNFVGVGVMALGLGVFAFVTQSLMPKMRTALQKLIWFPIQGMSFEINWWHRSLAPVLLNDKTIPGHLVPSLAFVPLYARMLDVSSRLRES